MRVRIHLTSGAVVDAEEYSATDGATWWPIEVKHVVAAMNADTGFTLVRDVFTDEWRAFRNTAIESIGPSPDLDAAVDAEAERRIGRLVAGRLPQRVVEAAGPPVERPRATPPEPVAEGRPTGGRRRGGQS